METKPWYLSKTLWLNAIGLIILSLQVGTDVIPWPTKYTAFALAILNGLLRIITSGTITATDQRPPEPKLKE